MILDTARRASMAELGRPKSLRGLGVDGPVTWAIERYRSHVVSQAAGDHGSHKTHPENALSKSRSVRDGASRFRALRRFPNKGCAKTSREFAHDRGSVARRDGPICESSSFANPRFARLPDGGGFAAEKLH
jgi:hypothetical protein